MSLNLADLKVQRGIGDKVGVVTNTGSEEIHEISLGRIHLFVLKYSGSKVYLIPYLFVEDCTAIYTPTAFQIAS